LCADGNVVDFYYAAAFEESEFAVGNADDDATSGLRLGHIGIFGTGLSIGGSRK
jgi:hypothetical protein